MEPEEHRQYGDHATSGTVRGSNPGKKSWYFPLPKRSDRVWGPPTLPFKGHWGCLLGLKRPGPKGNHSIPSSAKIKNEGHYSSSPAIRLRGADRINFTSILLSI